MRSMASPEGVRNRKWSTTGTWVLRTPDNAGNTLPLLWAAQYTLKEEKGSLGALFGFVDLQMSLLALESDVVSQKIAEKFADAGVPPLHPEDIIIDTDKIASPPKNNAVIEFTPVNQPTADATGINMSILLLENGWITLHFEGTENEQVDIILVGIDGSIIGQWKDQQLQDSRIRLQVPCGLKGSFILQVRSGKTKIQRNIRFCRIFRSPGNQRFPGLRKIFTATVCSGAEGGRTDG